MPNTSKAFSISKTLPRAFNYLNGNRHVPHGKGKFLIVEPAKGVTLGECQISDTNDVDEAVVNARRAFPVWSSLSQINRSNVLHKTASTIREHLNEIAHWETRDNGKPIYEARWDVEGVADTFDFFAAAAATIHGDHHDLGSNSQRFAYVRREPLGVCAGIGAWNYPFQTCSWKVAPALACGNTFVYKPSHLTPLTACILAEILTHSGAPPGTFNIVQGDGDTGRSLCEHKHVAKVSFTGSCATGAAIQRTCAAQNVKPCTLELGGKSPLIIFEDTPIENAVGGAMMANFLSQGEVCNNGTRVFVQKKIYDKFCSALVDCVRKQIIGDPMKETTRVGATISEEHMKRVLDYVKIAKDEGATILYGGERVRVKDDGCENGYFLSPCVVTNVRDDMRIMCEEVFGAVACVTPFDTEDEVIHRANDTHFGLAAGVFTLSGARAHRCAEKLQAGVVYVNSYNDVGAAVPFGGYKQSGYGRENGLAALNSYSQLKSVFVNTSDTYETPFTL